MMEYVVHNLFSTEAGVVWLVLKWILVVLAAGFVGQFGKVFATHLIQRTREKKKKAAVPVVRQQAPPPALKEEAVPPAVPEDAGPAAGTAPATGPDTTEAARLRESQEAEREAREQEVKKARKERAKIRKKTLKGFKKLFK